MVSVAAELAAPVPRLPPPHMSTVHRGSPPDWAAVTADNLGLFCVSSLSSASIVISPCLLFGRCSWAPSSWHTAAAQSHSCPRAPVPRPPVDHLAALAALHAQERSPVLDIWVQQPKDFLRGCFSTLLFSPRPASPPPNPDPRICSLIP